MRVPGIRRIQLEPFLIVAIVFLAGASRAGAQVEAGSERPAITRAYRTTSRITIDGRDDEAIWRSIAPTSGFRQYFPQEDGTPTVETQFKVAYDDRNLYVFVRAFDPHPDSIMRAMTRRDVSSASDAIGITIDGFHDRRTGVEFAINPDGVKKDCAVYADTLFDWSWDGVWDAAARVDSLGWTAEFRIPFSQFRYANTPRHVFGLAVWRGSYRYYESSIWPLWRISRGGLMSQLGDLVGVDDIAPPRAIGLLPYTVTKNVSRLAPGGGYGRLERTSLGGDVKYIVGPNITLNATVNPDFGQVEADPSVLNLTTAETFYPEKRPFFLEGSRLYQYDLRCNPVSCANEGIFYSRRIGRAPQLGAVYGDANSVAATPILGAAKLTGRSDGGLSVAMLDALTDRASGNANRTTEPRTNYGVVRLVQELDGGRVALGATGTTVDRALDRFTSDTLRQSAYVGAFDFRSRFGAWGLSGSLTGSRVAGTAHSIAATQLAPTHNFQRPDGHFTFDSARTALAGDAEEITLGRYSGVVQFLTSWQRHSAGLEVNDVGYMQRSNFQTASAGVSATIRTPHGIFRTIQTVEAWSRNWTTDWLPIGENLTADVNTRFVNNWTLDVGAIGSQLGVTFCDLCARGGPAIRQGMSIAPAITLGGDSRRGLVPTLAIAGAIGEGGRSRTWTLSPSVTVQVVTRLQGSLGASYTSNINDTQWFGNFTDTGGTTHYAFALLDQRTLSLTARGSFAATPNLTFELYASPFTSVGRYSDVRELSATPRAASFDERFVAYTTPSQAVRGFAVRQLRSNVVTRWEYRPGSTLFVVWTHGRDARDPVTDLPSFSDQYRRLFAAHPDNTFLVKMSYWLST